MQANVEKVGRPKLNLLQLYIFIYILNVCDL